MIDASRAPTNVEGVRAQLSDDPLLKTESGELSQNVSYDRANNLPVITIGGNNTGAGNVRNPLAVITLMPGAQFSNENTLRINGMPSSSQSIRIEGQDATNGFWRQLNQGVQTSTDAIQEVSIQTSNYSPEYGQAGGGYINYTMRSGTNRIHGSAYSYIQNDFMNAGLPFTDASLSNSLKTGHHIRNSIRRYDFGRTFSGPVRIPKLYNGSDKTFFFFSYEQFISHTLTGNRFDTVPTAAYQQGNFASALNPQLLVGGVPQTDPSGNPLFGNQIFDPLTQTTVNGLVVRQPFPGKRYPSDASGQNGPPDTKSPPPTKQRSPYQQLHYSELLQLHPHRNPFAEDRSQHRSHEKDFGLLFG
jgi:hypothetical protein